MPMWHRHILSITASGRITGRIMDMDRITDIVIGTIEDGEAIGTVLGTTEGMREGAGGTEKSGKIPPR